MSLPTEVQLIIRLKTYTTPIEAWTECIIPFVYQSKDYWHNRRFAARPIPIFQDERQYPQVGHLFANGKNQYHAVSISCFTLVSLRRVCKMFNKEITRKHRMKSPNGRVTFIAHEYQKSKRQELKACNKRRNHLVKSVINRDEFKDRYK